MLDCIQIGKNLTCKESSRMSQIDPSLNGNHSQIRGYLKYKLTKNLTDAMKGFVWTPPIASIPAGAESCPWLR